MTQPAHHRPAAARWTAWLAPLAGAVNRRFTGRRGTVQLALLVVAAAVLGGLALGTGVASSSVRTGYDLAWLADSGRGQVVQVDPERGRTNVRLQVAATGSQLEIQQRDGQLVVVDRRTGTVTSVNIGTLLLSGSRSAHTGAVKVLLAHGRMYIADLTRGSVQAADSATVASIGTPWTAGDALTDVGIDGRDQVWALDASQHVISLRWDDARRTLVRSGSYALQGAGKGSVIVAHDQGVTVVGGQGAIARIGTGHDTNLMAGHVSGPLTGPRTSPDTPVPVADPGRSSVIIVGDDHVLVDDVSSLGCSRPKAPTVFQAKIYVPCAGAHKVVVLDAEGHQSGSAIPTPAGGDPQLTVSGDRLIVDVPSSGQAKVIDGSGHTKAFRTLDPHVPVQNPRSAPPPPPPPPAPVTHHGRHHDGGDVPAGSPAGNGNGNGSSDGHGTDAPPAAGSTDASATADVRSDGSVVVDWQGPAVSGGYTVTDQATGSEVADVPKGATSATVTVLDAGATATLVVHAHDSRGHEKWTATTNTVTVTGAPGSVSDVKYTAARTGTGSVKLTVHWSAADAHGGRVSYTVGASTTSSTVSTNDTSATIEVPCATTCSGTVTVTPGNGSGHGTAATVSYEVAAASAPKPPAGDPPQKAPDPPKTQDPPAPKPMPAGGEQMITGTAKAGNDFSGLPAYADLVITAPGDWASWTGGTCTLYDTLSISGTTYGTTNQGTVACNASGLSKSLEYEESGTHTFKITASDGSRTVDSAAFTLAVIYRHIPCSGFANIGGINDMPPCNDCPPNDPGQPRVICNRFRQGLPAEPTRPDLARRIVTGLIG